MELRVITEEMVSSVQWTEEDLRRLNVSSSAEIADGETAVDPEGRLFWVNNKVVSPLYFRVPEWAL